MFGKEPIPACGFSLGLERILVVMDERKMFRKDIHNASADLLVTVNPYNREDEDKDLWSRESFQLATELRETGFRVLLFPTRNAKLSNQIRYASNLNIPFVCILGENEIANGAVALKDMATGEQESIPREGLLSRIRILAKELIVDN
jgi:histidyl-tRNA synthetase